MRACLSVCDLEPADVMVESATSEQDPVDALLDSHRPGPSAAKRNSKIDY